MQTSDAKIFHQIYCHVIIIILLLGGAYAFFVNREIPKPTPAERMMFLVNELTTTPERQQIALDEIVKGGDEAVVQIFPYLNDERRTATNNVKFLNMHPRISEKYFLSGASSVDELLLRYLCWQTISCDPWFNVNDETSKARQREKLAKFCQKKFSEGAPWQILARCG